MQMGRANEVIKRSQASSGELQDAEWQLKSLEIRVSEKEAALEMLLSDSDDELENQVPWRSPCHLNLCYRRLDTQLREDRR